jgi:hypothetical protein
VLTADQRAELEEHGPASIRFKLIQYGAGRGASISGFKYTGGLLADARHWDEGTRNGHAPT